MSLAVVAGVVVSCSPIGTPAGSRRARGAIFERGAADTTGQAIEEPVRQPAVDTTQQEGNRTIVDTTAIPILPDGSSRRAELDSLTAAMADSLLAPADSFLSLTDSLLPVADSARIDSVTQPRGPRRRDKPFLEAPVVGHAQDSVVYDRRRNYLSNYYASELIYQDADLKGDYIGVDATTKEIIGTGMLDTAGVMTRPEFVQGGANYTMDTVRYNLDSQKALVQGVATQDGEGFMLAERMKRMPDGTMNGEQLIYTTCDLLEHPHFYIKMTKARVIPGKKIITGPAYFVMEDVPIYFLGIPGGFFPMSVGPTAGIIMPTWGEEANRGFYLRGGGYYFTFGDHLDLSLTGDLYTLGSWGLNAASRYIKRYKFSGGVTAAYNRFVMGDPNPQNSSTFSLTWNHTQDPKANPRQNFSAQVNFQTAGQRQLATTSLQDHLNTSTTSSISYSRRWDVGSTSVNLTASFNMTTNARDSTVSVTLPNMSLSVGSFAPFKRKNAIGKQRWYEKITVDYNMQAQNQTAARPGATGNGPKENEFFTKETLRDLQNGVSHRLNVKTSLNLLNYINFSPSFSYQEAWNFKRKIRQWDPVGGPNGTGVLVPEDELETEGGFFRTYGWNVTGSLSTKLYGVFQVKRREGKTGWLQAFRHMVTPNLSFTYAPNFKHPRYGFYEYVQNNANGSILEYLPVKGQPTITPESARASINGSISNQFEIKVKDRRDSTGMKKITVIEQLSLSGISWNFLADSLHMGSGVSVSLRTGEIFKGFALQLSGNWDPYRWVDDGRGTMKRTGKFNIGKGKFGRITSTSWSFGKSFNSPQGSSPASGSLQNQFVNPYDAAYDPYNFSNSLDPLTRRQYMVQGYYDFNVPWSFNFNYSINYAYTSQRRPQITQNLGFNGNITLTPKWGFHFESGYDFTRRKLSHMQLSLTRDLHCWDMSFNWVPMGRTKMYSFHIGVKSGMLRDIKYDKSSNSYDNLAY
jgi:hypothetical protein